MRRTSSIIFLTLLLFIITACQSSGGSSATANSEDTTPPLFTSLSTIAVNENEYNAITLTATDTNPVSFNISGVDSASFTLNNTTGVVTFVTPPDFESKSSYAFTATASDGVNSSTQNVTITILDVAEIPTLVVIMSWNNYTETDPLIWSNKIFNPNENSVNQWYRETDNGRLQLIPVMESSGTDNDGVIIVNMGKDHPGGFDYTTFRDTEIANAISNAEVVDNVDFAALDTDGDGALNKQELQIIFIVAGGEESYGDPADHSIWAHAWAFPSNSTLQADGVYVMRYTGNEATSGSYARFGAKHDTHSATIGVIVHELGHSLLGLGDYYDNGGGSGLGYYDIMSNGSWAFQNSDIYHGQTPTQYSAYNRIDTGLDTNLAEVNATQELQIKCSSNELIKLITPKTNEYFLIECRDTSKSNSDISFSIADSSFTENRLFLMSYHVDTDKTDNTQDGVQTNLNHYKVALVEKDTLTLMTSTTGIYANYDDVYTLGNVISTAQTRLYDGTVTNYALEVLSEDYNTRTMTVRITK